MKNKTGLQPVSRPVELFHFFGGWVEHAKTLWCQGFADRQPYRIGGGSRSIKLTGKFNGCFLGKTRLTKKFQINFRRGGGLRFLELILKTMFQDLCSTGKNKENSLMLINWE